ncbi:hypothetical protein NQ318_012264 [Aromia moschata]|uniref:Uncharacterized protein n=1 Tax=Aromia moschata TaxID=1265417 RepID=A0AAV8XH14_9CUCU|nr:hypothetical protein NQ318_012264 [Aromia moschata]
MQFAGKVVLITGASSGIGAATAKCFAGLGATLALAGRNLENLKKNILVNNAGILETGSIEATNLEQYDRVMNTNVRAIYQLTTLAVPHLIKTKGNIVNVSSVNGIRAFPGVLAYCVSKAAVDQFTRCTGVRFGTKASASQQR